jgi:membrane protease YdiL (CAAX protease family)
MVRRQVRINRLYELSLARPILVPLILLAVAVLLRVMDIMILPFAERWGEAFLHKAVGFVLILAYLWAVGRSLAAIGLRNRQAGRGMLIGAVGTVLVLVLAFGLQWIVSRAAGRHPTLVVAATDNKTGLAKPGLTYALWLLLGNVVNSFMEEGLFRGIMLTHFRVRLSRWQANALQAVLFGLWHIIWPIRHLVAGRIDLSAALSQSILIVIGSTISGLAWGYLFLKTGNLWSSWIAHTINNSTLNLLHVSTVDGLDADTIVLNAMLGVGLLVLMPWTKLWTEKWQMLELKPWGSEA